MRNILIFFFIVATSQYYGFCQEKNTILTQMKQDVNYLASDKLKGRKTGTIGEKRAAKYIAQKFKYYQLSEKGTKKYYQKFKGKLQHHHHQKSSKKNITGLNIIGFCDNNKKETIIIGAHYDHLGKKHQGSLHIGKKEIHNGADDNASGVSILINLIDTLCQKKSYNYLFIAFSGEEEGLLGSSYFTKNPTIDLDNVRFMLNFDMVGRLNEKRELAINGTGTSPSWPQLLKESNTCNLKLVLSDSGMGPSDHAPFYLNNIPVLHFFTGQHEDYHKPSDDIDKINFEGMHDIISYVVNIIEKSSKIDNFNFQETMQDNTSMPRFSVTLGIMPDYLYDGTGLRIDGVTKGKTASKHGLKKDDVIIKLGDEKINNIMDYMNGLSQFKKGDKTLIEILRDKKSIIKSITFL